MAEENNNGRKPEEQKPETQPLIMQIEMSPEGLIKVTFPFLADKVATYGFLKMAEKTLDGHYAKLSQPKIVPARGGFRDLFRR